MSASTAAGTVKAVYGACGIVVFMMTSYEKGEGKETVISDIYQY